MHRHKMILGTMFGLQPDYVRVVSRDVGGGFGPRNMMHPSLLLFVGRHGGPAGR